VPGFERRNIGVLMTTSQGPPIFKRIESLLVLLLISLLLAIPALAAPPNEYFPVPGLMDLRTTFSDGAHSPEDVVTIARLRGFRVLFFNDHHRIKLSYGIPPFRNLLKYSREFPSIMTHGPRTYLKEIDRLSGLYPDMILIPGSIISPFYYWSGSWFSGDLTVHQYDRKILAFNLTRAEDYERIPTLEGSLSTTHTGRRLPGLVLFIIPWFIGLYLLIKEKGFLRFIGVTMVTISSLAMVDYNPFRASVFTPYSGDQGIVPFQETIDYIHQQGGFALWDYPEQRSGVRKHGPVYVNTPPYPEVLWESKNYAGFAAIYGDRITVTDPGKHWDLVLMEYCVGRRERPVWGVSTADFHEDGRLGLRLGGFPTTFLVKEFSKDAILDALRKGRMYCSRGDGRSWPQLDYFNILGSEGGQAHMGETLTTVGFPLIRFKVSYTGGEKVPMTIHLVRGGTLLRTLQGKTPLEFELLDDGAPAGRMTYYRLMDSQKHLTSNPIFVRRQN
jgi:hypothetical protein